MPKFFRDVFEVIVNYFLPFWNTHGRILARNKSVIFGS